MQHSPFTSSRGDKAPRASTLWWESPQPPNPICASERCCLSNWIQHLTPLYALQFSYTLLSYLANPGRVSLEGAWDTHTSWEDVAFLKAAYLPAPTPSKRPTELTFVLATLADHPVNNTCPKYKGYKAEVFLFVSVDIRVNNIGVRHFGYEGHTAVATRGFLVIVACALQHLLDTQEETPTRIVTYALSNVAESFSFGDIRK